jgi:hypothetical protein
MTPLRLFAGGSALLVTVACSDRAPASETAAAAVTRALTPQQYTSKEFAAMSRAVWSGFECAALASKLKKNEDAERLFKFAYERGKTFMAGLQAGNVKDEDLRTEMPMIVGWLIRDGGPSVDFILGKVWSEAQDEALKDVYKTDDKFNSDEV